MGIFRSGLIVITLVFLGACANSQSTGTNPESNSTQTTATVEADTTGYKASELTSLKLTNAKTGESFTLSDFAGKTVSVEPMSVTCSSCKKQHKNSKQAYEKLPDSEYIFLSLSIDQGLSDEKLAEFAKSEGFNWKFAVATPEITRVLNAKFGQTAFNTASTPHFIISPNGEISELSTGFTEPDVLVAKLQQVKGQ
ncbi:MAG: redoxin family protein [Symploca sp. SIO3C6]|uniref:Redoxin family protein n=1 Tax=Symploca sp. SIO1C4 TaxID=2607765 RepID=A0A6B3NN01_9CYAN|nr:redoxin family protein [Symploca sp. SIO3C6]NER30921.1 redoxin family protein [Symploca sp. SIO1C4]